MQWLILLMIALIASSVVGLNVMNEVGERIISAGETMGKVGMNVQMLVLYMEEHKFAVLPGKDPKVLETLRTSMAIFTDPKDPNQNAFQNTEVLKLIRDMYARALKGETVEIKNLRQLADTKLLNEGVISQVLGMSKGDIAQLLKTSAAKKLAFTLMHSFSAFEQASSVFPQDSEVVKTFREEIRDLKNQLIKDFSLHRNDRDKMLKAVQELIRRAAALLDSAREKKDYLTMQRWNARFGAAGSLFQMGTQAYRLLNAVSKVDTKLALMVSILEWGTTVLHGINFGVQMYSAFNYGYLVQYVAEVIKEAEAFREEAVVLKSKL